MVHIGFVTTSRFRWWSTLVLLAAGSLGAGESGGRAAFQPGPGGVARAIGPRLEHLPPGTAFRADRAPAGWSQLVLKSTPVLTSGDLKTVSAAAHVTARRIRLAILADVGRESNAGPFRLRRIGLGLTAPVVGHGDKGGDVVVAATNVGDISGEWSTTERIVLAAGSRELSRATLTASTPTFAMIRTPTTCLVGSEHETVDVMYALLVDADSGRLRLFTCKPAEGDRSPVVRELDAPAVIESPLHVKAKLFAGIPISWSFAILDIPAGLERPLPPELPRLLTPDPAADVDVPTLETAFRKLAASPARESARFRVDSSSKGR